MKLYLFTTFFILQFSYVLAVEVKQTKERNIVLKAENCEALEVQAKSIIKWTSRVESRELSSPKCECSASSCEMDISQVVPLLAKKWHGIPSKHLSGNCWNTMLKVSNILPHDRSTDASELTFLLNSPTICKQKKSSEDLSPGDMILIRENNENLSMEQRELHGFIHISDEISFQKKGPGAGEPIEIVESRYAYTNIADPLCKNVDGHPPKDPRVLKKCPYYANVFSCKSIKEVKKQKEAQLQNVIKNKLKSIDQYECLLSQLNNSAISKVSDSSLTSLKDSMSVIKHWAQKHKEKDLNEADLFFTNYILGRANASLNHIEESSSRVNSLKSEFSGMTDEEFDFKVAQREEQIATWYESKKDEIDTSYDLLSFTKEHKRLPGDDQSASSEEKELFKKLKSFNFFIKLEHRPESFEIYLDEDVYNQLKPKG